MKTYMIGFSVSRNGLTSEIKCPCDEEEIRHVQDELDIPYDTDTSVTVIGVDSDIEQLSVLEGQTVDLDFLNLLGRLMDGMDCGEYEQFRIGLYHECFTDLRDIINTTQSVGRYSIIDPNNLRESGIDHEINLRGGVPAAEIDKRDFAAVAQGLIDSGKCEKTPYGLLHVNKEVPLADFFDGKHMPAYYDRAYKFACFLNNDTGEEFVFLPCSNVELLRAAKRLGSAFPYDLEVTIEDTTLKNKELMRLTNGADINTLNSFAKILDRFGEGDIEKLLAVLDYVDKYFGGIGDLRNVVRIGDNIHAFTFYPNAMGYEELGWTLLEEQDIPEELHKYFNAEVYGEDYLGEQAGRFTERGYVGINDYPRIKNCLRMTDGMGGME